MCGKSGGTSVCCWIRDESEIPITPNIHVTKWMARSPNIGDREANWLYILNANAPDEECNVECVALEAPPKHGSLERANGWRGGEPPFTARYIGGGGEGFLNLSYGDACDQPA